MVSMSVWQLKLLMGYLIRSPGLWPPGELLKSSNLYLYKCLYLFMKSKHTNIYVFICCIEINLEMPWLIFLTTIELHSSSVITYIRVLAEFVPFWGRVIREKNTHSGMIVNTVCSGRVPSMPSIAFLTQMISVTRGSSDEGKGRHLRQHGGVCFCAAGRFVSSLQF